MGHRLSSAIYILISCTNTNEVASCSPDVELTIREERDTNCDLQCDRTEGGLKLCLLLHPLDQVNTQWILQWILQWFWSIGHWIKDIRQFVFAVALLLAPLKVPYSSTHLVPTNPSNLTYSTTVIHPSLHLRWRYFTSREKESQLCCF